MKLDPMAFVNAGHLWRREASPSKDMACAYCDALGDKQACRVFLCRAPEFFLKKIAVVQRDV